MKTTTKSKWFSMLLAMLLVGLGSASAQTISIDDFQIDAGATKQVTINLVQGDLPVLGFQCDVDLPDGLIIQRVKAVNGILPNDEWGDPIQPSVSYTNGVILLYNDKGVTINSDASSLVTLYFKADDTFVGGDITLSNIIISGEGNVKIEPEDVIAKVASSSNYTITVQGTQNGAVTANKAAAAEGETVLLTVTPAEGYELESLAVMTETGVTVAVANNSFVMPAANVIVVALFKQIPVTPSVDPTITISDFQIDAGASKQVTIDLVQGSIPVLGFQCDVALPEGLIIQRVKAVSDILPDDEWGDPIQPSVSYTNGVILLYNDKGVTINSDASSLVTLYLKADDTFAGGDITLSNIIISGEGNVKIEPEAVIAKVTSNYVAPTNYTIIVQGTQNGSVTADKAEAAEGETVQLTVTPAEGYELESLAVMTNAGVTVAVSNNSFVMPAANVIVVALFKQIQVLPTVYTITVQSSVWGTVTPSKTEAAEGDFVELFIIESSGYRLASLEVYTDNGTAIDVSNNGFVMPASNVTVVVDFEKYDVTPTNDPSITISDFQIDAGATKQVTINLVQGSVPVLGFQTTVVLPEGLTIQRVKAVDGILPNDEWGDPIAASVNYNNENGTILLYNDKGVAIKSDASALVTLYLKASDTFAGGDLTLSSIIISGEGNVKIEPEAVTAKVTSNYVAPTTYTITAPSEVANGFCSVGQTTAKAGETVTAKIYANDGYEVSVQILTTSGQPVEYSVENGYVYNFVMPAEDVVVYVTTTKVEASYEFAEGEYLIYNVGAGQYLNRGNDWGTRASLAYGTNGTLVELAQVDGKYMIITGINGADYGLEHLSGGTVYTDQSRGKQSTWDIVPVTTGGAVVYNIISGENHGGGAGAYLTASAENTIVGVGQDGTSQYAQWQFINIAERKAATLAAMANATQESPVDATPLIDNANFSYSGLGNNAWTVVANNYRTYGGAYDNPCAESWHSTFTVSQTINDLPAGWYALTAQGFYRQDSEHENYAPVFFANDASALFPEIAGTENSMNDASVSFSQGLYTINPIYVYVAEGESLTIGARQDGSTNMWCIWDNFELTYLGANAEIDVPVVEPQLAMNGIGARVGEYVEATIDLIQGSVPVQGFQVDLNLPAGMSVTSVRAVDGILPNDDWGYSVEPSVTYNHDIDRLLIYNDQGLCFNPGAKGIVTLRFYIDRNCAGGDLGLTNIIISGKDNVKFTPDDVYVWVQTNYVAPTSLDITGTEYLEVSDEVNYESITLGYAGNNQYGALIASGTGLISTDAFSFYSDPNIEWEQRTNLNRHSAALVNDVDMYAMSLSSELWITDGKWFFLSFPYDVKVSDIIPEDQATEWVIRKYDGQARAAGQMDATWVQLGLNDVMEAYQGYIWQSAYKQGYSGFTVPALLSDNMDNFFANYDVNVFLNGYDSEFAHNRGWNLIGNPYPAYYDISYMDFGAPITAWNVNTQSYDAYSPADDNYVLYPFEAFFVQRPDEQESILFSAEGRQIDRKNVNSVKAANNAPARIGSREVLNLTLSDGTYTDRTRVVVNEQAKSSYEMDKDASKFFSTSSLAPQFFSIEGDIRYAINERPLADGIVELGATLVKAGRYTIALEAAGREVTLLDTVTGTRMKLNDGEGYSFDAEAGTIMGRFVLYIGEATGIAGVSSDSQSDTMYDLSGRRVQSASAPGVYIVNGKKVVKQSAK